MSPDEEVCPLCQEANWQIIGEGDWHRDSMAADLPEYVKQRLDVLFNVWYPKSDSVRLTYAVCRCCGFVTYLPRPTNEDLDAKYRHLSQTVKASHGAEVSTAGSDREKERSRLVYRHVSAHAADGFKSVLDFGGGDGRLMHAFLAEGCDCTLVDYAEPALEGVRKAGNTLDELKNEETFDAIVCSHVMEHLADPLQMTRHLKDYSRPGGVVYIEVPMEIWKRPPIHSEPVTHVNFFTRSTVRFMMESAGLTVLWCVLGSHHHPLGHRTAVVRAVGRRDEAQIKARPSGCGETEMLLHPGLREYVQYARVVPETMWRRMKGRIGLSH